MAGIFAGMSLGNRATRRANDLAPDRALAEAQLLAPDRLVAVVWPVLKIWALAADVAIARDRAPGRAVSLALRAVDWALFFSFPLAARRSPRVGVASGLAAAQAVATAAVMSRSRPSAARLLAGQLAWLSYATAVPVIAAARARRRA